MIVWIDAHLSPSLAAWINRTFSGIHAQLVRAKELQRASDRCIFEAAKAAGAVIMSNDADFLRLVDDYGVPPHVIWITCGNTSNARMREILSSSLERALTLIRSGEAVVEISDLQQGT